MALSSMTGFARADGVAGPYVWAWELKSVNAKGLELRLRVPPGWDVVEAPLRARAGDALGGGPINGNVWVLRAGVACAAGSTTAGGAGSANGMSRSGVGAGLRTCCSNWRSLATFC